MNSETIEKNWHVDTGAGVHETDAETLGQWIREGRVLRHHRISRGGMRWLEAGKVPQFAGYFPAHMNMPANTAATGYRPGPRAPEPAYYDAPSKLANTAPSFGLRLAAGTALAMFIAAAVAYAYAYYGKPPRDFAALLTTEPEAQALQTKYDEARKGFESSRAHRSGGTPSSTPAPVSKLGPAKTGDIAGRKTRIGNVEIDLDKMPQFRPAPPIGMPRFDVPRVDIDKLIADLTAKFEGDKKKMVEDAQAADAKSRFFPAFALLFMGLGGLNAVRIKFLSKK